MQLSVIGCGYLGAVHAAAMASLGHEVVGVDTNAARIEQLARGVAPFFEPGLDELLRQETTSGRLSFTTDIAQAAQADVHFICVGTPQEAGGRAADLSFVHAAFDATIAHAKPGSVLVGKSTVPVGTAASLLSRVEAAGAHLAWNPEFLREGWAVHDTLTPDRLVFGVADARGGSGDLAERALREVFETPLEAGTPLIVTDFATAELVKVSANAFLATKISFINAMAEISEVVGADVSQLSDALGYDDRIGRRFLGSGIGFGGGCLPKDIRAFTARAEELGRGESVAFLREVDAINQRRRSRAVELAIEAAGGSVAGTQITVLGAAFKPFSDDTRDSPALEVATRLHGLGARVVVTDPQAIENARTMHPQLVYIEDRDEALRGADVVVLVTEWDEYRRDLGPERAGELVSQKSIVDGRNCLDAEAWRAAGWDYRGLGRR